VEHTSLSKPSDLIIFLKSHNAKWYLPLDSNALGKLDRYFEELKSWNAKMNLIGFKDQESCVVTGFLDSLASYSLFQSNQATQVLDVGTGAGFPGLPSKIANPSLEMTLVEPNKKKVAFLHHVIGTLNLKDAYVEPKRIENLASEQQYFSKFDVVMIKALRIDVCLPYLSNLLHSNSQIVLYRSENLQKEENLFGFEIFKEIHYELPLDFGTRCLTVLKPMKSFA
jgi:16S rRNA (guanine527-N7)-methyltransferase